MNRVEYREELWTKLMNDELTYRQYLKAKRDIDYDMTDVKEFIND